MKLYKTHKNSTIFVGYTSTVSSTISNNINMNFPCQLPVAAVVCRKAHYNNISPNSVIPSFLINHQLRILSLPVQQINLSVNQ